ncbi:transcription factor ILI4-like isoform X1 [Actinidia eriantha]|uniref:transcription factor ILI4-like isoform X1 n=1 Tax=Actinidia eriantha TaxID=165200 RepID=UPI00258F715E|nr:transcription factor ILI4-like isoform X1 [Actinidia eriantha]
MSSRRVRASRTSEDELNELIFKLQAVLTESSSRFYLYLLSTTWLLHQAIEGCQYHVSPSKILKETCSYIKRLQREVDDLSERLSQLLASMDTSGSGLDVEILKSLLQQ